MLQALAADEAASASPSPTCSTPWATARWPRCCSYCHPQRAADAARHLGPVRRAPLLFLAAQMAFNMRAWLPAVIARARWRATTTPRWCRIAPWLVQPSDEAALTPLASGAMEVGGGTVCPARAGAGVAHPIDGMLPAAGHQCWRWASSNATGLWVLAGFAAAAGAAAPSPGVLWAIVKAALYVIRNAAGAG